jgi:hypothetical protein
VDIQLVVPAANTDGTRPADVARVDIYGFTGPPTVTAEEIFRRGARVGSILVNPPRDPDEPPEAPQRGRPRPRPGVEQGTTARLKDELAAGGAPSADARSYISVGFSTRGRRGALSGPAAVALVAPPPPPSEPQVVYDEQSITVAWSAAAAPSDRAATLGYHVYEPMAETPLTEHPLTETRYVDRRIEWGAERCYAVRTVETVDGLSVESDLSGVACATLTDTFPPGAPTGLTAVAAQGAISLVWDASSAADLAGYLVLRAIAPANTLVPVTPTPIEETTFTDHVAAGARVTYAVRAVDKAGNASPLSNRIEETAR